MTTPIEDRLERVAFDVHPNTSTAVLMHEAVETIRQLRKEIEKYRTGIAALKAKIERELD